MSPPASPALSAVSRLQALAAPPPPIQLTPSLSRLYKEQLIGHVLAWPAEHVERGINKVGEDANQISNHAITKVRRHFSPQLPMISAQSKTILSSVNHWVLNLALTIKF